MNLRNTPKWHDASYMQFFFEMPIILLSCLLKLLFIFTEFSGSFPLSCYITFSFEVFREY